MDKYKMIKHRDTVASNLWWRKCENKGNHPFIVIKNKYKYSIIEYDYLAFNDENINIIDNSRGFAKECIKIFKKYCNKKSRYSVSAHIVIFENIDMLIAPRMVSELYDLTIRMINGEFLIKE